MFSAMESAKLIQQMSSTQHNSTQSSGAVHSKSSFAIDLSDCFESSGVALVATERAQKFLPPEFQLLNNGQPVTPLVLLAFRCKSIAVADGEAKPGVIVQMGPLIASPDGTGEINAYLLSYYTSHLSLARRLQFLGLPVRYAPAMEYSLTLDHSGGSVSVIVPNPKQPSFALAGQIQAPAIPGTLVANWWAKVENIPDVDTHHRIVKMFSTVPSLLRGEANLTLRTQADTLLGQLIGGTSTGFAVAQQFNTFQHAHTEVTVTGVSVATLPVEMLAAQGG